MNSLNERQQAQLREIKKWAEENGNQISYITLQDLLKYERQPVTDNESMVNQIIHELIEQGIRVEPLNEGESYGTQPTEQEGFVPALVNIVSATQNISSVLTY